MQTALDSAYEAAIDVLEKKLGTIGRPTSGDGVPRVIALLRQHGHAVRFEPIGADAWRVTVGSSTATTEGDDSEPQIAVASALVIAAAQALEG